MTRKARFRYALNILIQPPYPIVLASASPRRQKLLKELFPEFSVLPAEVEENLPAQGNPWATATGFAKSKAWWVQKSCPEAFIIAGDTIVALPQSNGEHQLLGKPTDTARAKSMLEALSGRVHLVVTAICLVWPGGERSFHETTQVFFRELNEQEIDRYIATGEPFDKAGSYGLQGHAREFVEKIEGSDSNVIGLPLEKLRQALLEWFAQG